VTALEPVDNCQGQVRGQVARPLLETGRGTGRAKPGLTRLGTGAGTAGTGASGPLGTGGAVPMGQPRPRPTDSTLWSSSGRLSVAIWNCPLAASGVADEAATGMWWTEGNVLR
jgi:hypothetical protein